MRLANILQIIALQILILTYAWPFKIISLMMQIFTLTSFRVYDFP